MTVHVSPPKTALSPDDVRHLLRHYNLVLRAFSPIPRGTINSNYSVTTDEGHLFLRVCEGKSVADAAFESMLIWQLGSHGVRTPALWRTRCGDPFVSWQPTPGSPVKPVMLFSWVTGRDLTDADLDDSHAYHVGELLAQLHLGAAAIHRAHPGIYTLRHITHRLEKLHLDAQAQADLGFTLTELAAEATLLASARRSDLPTGIGHNDLFPDNLLFPRRLSRHRPAHDPDAGGWILDLEQAATLPYAYDVAVSLLACCAPHPATPTPDAAAPAEISSDPHRVGPLRLDTAQALLAGYQSLRALSPVEWQGLYQELRFAALRFTVTRLTDVHRYGSATPTKSVAGKDFREFLWRLRQLTATDPNQLRSQLQSPVRDRI